MNPDFVHALWTFAAYLAVATGVFVYLWRLLRKKKP